MMRSFPSTGVKGMCIYEGHIKRFFDMFFSGIAIIGLSPVMIIVAILVRFKLGSPVFFSQERQ